MKESPESLNNYILQTEYAVKHLYLGLHDIWSIYEEALTHWDMSKVTLELTPELKSELDKYCQLSEQYFFYRFSEATLCGSILQIAFMAIYHYSTNTVIPDSCKEIVQIVQSKNLDVIKKFCIGKEVCGLPLGLIIYSARNQYNHWDVELRQFNKMIFERLDYENRHNIFADLAYDLNNPTIVVYAHHILLGLLRWQNYDTYKRELKDMFK